MVKDNPCATFTLFNKTTQLVNQLILHDVCFVEYDDSIDIIEPKNRLYEILVELDTLNML